MEEENDIQILKPESGLGEGELSALDEMSKPEKMKYYRKLYRNDPEEYNKRLFEIRNQIDECEDEPLKERLKGVKGLMEDAAKEEFQGN
ncbi:hypothetical protein C4569_03085 [Candidatus Parcubacteria bacterium]|nr:MAG: hypothetical protein C4569_03085 [Candidatus Parcubacteria bacterium]